MSSGHYRPLTRLSIAVPIAVCIGLGVLLAVGRSGSAVPIIDDLTILGLSTYATVCAVLAARTAVGRMRVAWSIMAVAVAAWAVADLIWLLCDYVLQVEPFPSPADLFYLAFTVLTVPGLLAMAPFDAWSRRQAKVRITLDGVTVALCVFLLAWITALSTVYDTYRDDKLALVLALFYPASDIVILAVSVAVLARVETRQRAALGLLVVAFAIMTVTDSAFASAVAQDNYVTGSLMDVGWAAASATIGIAALKSRRTPPPRPATVSVPSGTALWAPYLPLLLVGTVGLPLVTTGLEQYVVPVIIVAVCLRQFVAARENRQWLKAAAEHSLRDSLTGLANTTLFHDRLSHAMMLHARDDRSVMVASLDLDDFAFVNLNIGHPAADRLLVHAARRIAACVRPGDTVGRAGGDEFALLLEGDVHASQRVLQRVVETFDEPFEVDGEQVTIRCSVGIAVVFADEPDVTPETMLTRADVAVRAAKQSHSRRIRFFEEDMEQTDPDSAEAGDRNTELVSVAGAARVRLLSELRRAVDHGDLELAYQPKVDLVGGQVVGVESLLRWPHPDLGLLYPGTFMPLVREHKLIRPVTDLVIDKALDDAARWLTGGVHMPVAVNLFAPSLRDTRLPTSLREALERRGLPAGLLTVEITEDLVINDLDRVTGVLEQLREHGIPVAIDDFGSGYSALSYLRDLVIDEIKLDRSFIASVTTDLRAAVVVAAIIELTHGLGMTVVAEGIEEAATANWLRDSGCDVGQGYHFGRPIDADDVPSLAHLAIGPL
ncbi:bifunctional diguanylate cyclase/phosphodiesterase [Mycobacterium sp. 236(2023)]|uniref:putative bifunctional diguanylate cyclase/phosphodiesterase n=1 Tax=Mycobacterium sp. 236(2023) TaxID=3038163 RepID=UPI002414DBEC|nr:bifunctional diguanylate cyclase/phosphodiesterase [Mycobacterium sp. 236(2023)]MDG4669215.1 bifunctional diguanylate cyclase/phosphodiesterase [Mycobacterium sp. 236(2023)]